jgi:dihydrofolate reductase
MVTLDGYIAGPNGEIDWHNVDEEFNAFAIAQLKDAGCIIFGRVTYDLMADHWPSESARESDPLVAQAMNTLPKIVCSRRLDEVDWDNTKLVRDNVADQIAAMKAEPGKDMYVFGSADLAATLIQHNLIDEFRLMLNPVILGRGKPLFREMDHPHNLTLVSTRAFDNGNVLLNYRLA